MFDYYMRATICYALLLDADANISRCKWFTRGWTLQELLAPTQMKFFGSRLNFIGTKEDLLDTIEDITRVDREALMQTRSLDSFSVATKMSWAAWRQTTRPEDRAYSLLGIFDVHMPLIYGEGYTKAFHRLQKEIISTSTDQSVFVWCPSSGLYSARRHQLLANSPDDFKLSSRVVPWHQSGVMAPYHLSNCGLEIRLPIIEDDRGYSYGILQCRSTHIFTGPLALPLISCPDILSHLSEGPGEQRTHTYEVDRNPGHTFDIENQIDGEYGLFGLSYVPLEKLNKATSVPITILKERDPLTSLSHFAGGFFTWPKIWIRTTALEEEAIFQTKVFPTNLWMSSNTFDSTSATLHSGIKAWYLEDGFFVLAFCIPSGARDAANCPEGLHMAIAQPKELSRTSKNPPWERIMSTLLEHTSQVNATSAHFKDWRSVRVEAELTERMGERIYCIDVTIVRELPGHPSEFDSLASRKRRRS